MYWRFFLLFLPILASCRPLGPQGKEYQSCHPQMKAMKKEMACEGFKLCSIKESKEGRTHLFLNCYIMVETCDARVVMVRALETALGYYLKTGDFPVHKTPPTLEQFAKSIDITIHLEHFGSDFYEVQYLDKIWLRNGRVTYGAHHNRAGWDEPVHCTISRAEKYEEVLAEAERRDRELRKSTVHTIGLPLNKPLEEITPDLFSEEPLYYEDDLSPQIYFEEEF